MIRVIGGDRPIFILEGRRSVYIFRVLATGHLEHLYYGRRIRVERKSDLAPLIPKRAFAPGNTILYDNGRPDYSLESICLEWTSPGKGDPREPMIEVVDARGNRSADWIYENYEIQEGKSEMVTMPSAWAEDRRMAAAEVKSDDVGANSRKNEEPDGVEELRITLRDRLSENRLDLYYAVFPQENVITRRALLTNESQENITIRRLMSYGLDLRADVLDVISFDGGWAHEMNQKRQPLTVGKWSMTSRTGTSSSRCNPFFMLSSPDCGEERGEAYAFNLIYSGNHYAAAERTPAGLVRVLAGISPEDFSWQLSAGDSFESPEAVLTYSDQGFNGISVNMHGFVREHILRGVWAKKDRPILLNSWESHYFDISEKKLLSLGREAARLGIELLVMDDGWFGERTDDHRSLGDWTPDPKKLPGGLKSLADQIHGLGLDFGIWVEPEMVNTDSDFYRQHPDWTMELPWKRESQAEGRNQRILDLANPQVVDEMIRRLKELFSSAEINYVKWDMNRIFSDVYSPALPFARQQETDHRYVLGLYRMMKELTEAYPRILFEGCAAGGNRFDLGILSYFPQIWGSDDTDPVARINIQRGYSYGYPQICFGSHVSASPNHQTLRRTSLDTRFAVAAFGNLGYELNPKDLSKEEREVIRSQVALYKKYRHTLQSGQFFRGRGDNEIDWTIVSSDKRQALGFYSRIMNRAGEDLSFFYPRGLDPARRYHFFNRPQKVDVRAMGSLINQKTPLHVKEGGLLHSMIARFVQLEGEKEDLMAYGDVLMAGVATRQNFVGTGYNEQVRYLPDFACRLYFMEEVVSSDDEGDADGAL